jgi:hypothetical protein
MGEIWKKTTSIKVEKKDATLALILGLLFGGLGLLLIALLYVKDEEQKKAAMILGVIIWLTFLYPIAWWAAWVIYSNSK